MANAYDRAVMETIPKTTAWFLATRLANATMMHGHSAVSHNSLAKVCRTSPRKIGKAIQELIDNGFARYEGRASCMAHQSTKQSGGVPSRIAFGRNPSVKREPTRCGRTVISCLPRIRSGSRALTITRRKPAEPALRRLYDDADEDSRLTGAARTLYRKIITSYNWALGYAECSDSFVVNSRDISLISVKRARKLLLETERVSIVRKGGKRGTVVWSTRYDLPFGYRGSDEFRELNGGKPALDWLKTPVTLPFDRPLRKVPKVQNCNFPKYQFSQGIKCDFPKYHGDTQTYSQENSRYRPLGSGGANARRRRGGG